MTNKAKRPRLLKAIYLLLLAAGVITLGAVLFQAQSLGSETVFPENALNALTLNQKRDSISLDESDGILPEGATIFDDQYPGISNLNDDLLQALQQAAEDAQSMGIVFYVASGWRTPAYQEQLLREEIESYGSIEEAARWAAPADKSVHLLGKAADMAGESKTWLSESGSRYGICQVYENEPWHFELRPNAPTEGCPAMYSSAADDPRLQ